MQRPSRDDENVLDIASGASVRQRPYDTDATVLKTQWTWYYSGVCQVSSGSLYALSLCLL
jgi:hypothetical protein